MIKRKSLCLSYILLTFGGWLGLHHLYLGRDIQAFIYWCTFGGYFGLGPLRDFYRLPSYVKEANYDSFYYEHLAKLMHSNNKPPFNLTRFVAQILVGNSWCFLWIAAFPDEPIFGISLLPLIYFGPLAAALGVWLIGNIGREQGSLKWCVLGSYLMIPLAMIDFQYVHWCCVSSSLLFEWKGKQWRRAPGVKRPLCRRLLHLSLGWMLFCSLWGSYIYFKAEITYKDGEKAKVKDAIQNFFKSPMFLEFKNNMWKLYEDAKEYGWSVAWMNFLELIDPLGEQHALKVLGLKSGASQEEISARFKSLSKEWHPDRHKTLEAKQIAQEKFVEIADAYEKLSDIKRRRKTKSKKSEYETT